MVGGTTSGYCATGSARSATPPTIRSTMERTLAKIGRSMKKCESMAGVLLRGLLSRGRRRRLRPRGRGRGLAFRGVIRQSGFRRRPRRGGISSSGRALRIHGPSDPGALHAVHDDPVFGPEAFLDLAHLAMAASELQEP